MLNLDLGAKPYTMRGYAYSGGGRQVRARAPRPTLARAVSLFLAAACVVFARRPARARVTSTASPPHPAEDLQLN